MNPQMIEQLARQRLTEIRQAAARSRLAAVPRVQRKAIGQRAASTLTRAGLRGKAATQTPSTATSRPERTALTNSL